MEMENQDRFLPDCFLWIFFSLNLFGVCWVFVAMRRRASSSAEGLVAAHGLHIAMASLVEEQRF